jgi:hypothetical protein
MEAWSERRRSRFSNFRPHQPGVWTDGLCVERTQIPLAALTAGFFGTLVTVEKKIPRPEVRPGNFTESGGEIST